MQLDEYAAIPDNPFMDYFKFDGKVGQGSQYTLYQITQCSRFTQGFFTETVTQFSISAWTAAISICLKSLIIMRHSKGWRLAKFCHISTQ